VFRHEERTLVEIRRYHQELRELEDFLVSANDYRSTRKPFELLVDRLSDIRRQAQRADLLVLSRPSEGQLPDLVQRTQEHLAKEMHRVPETKADDQTRS
jgi:hypothetical protein